MAKPYIHAESSARRYGGKPEDYIDIHNLMDSSKGTIADNRHRALTHNSWFLFILEKIFGVTRVNSDGKTYSVRDIGEQHVLEDFGMKYIPTPQDYLQEMEYKDWMQNGQGYPPSFSKIEEKRKAKLPKVVELSDFVVDGSRDRLDQSPVLPEPPVFVKPPQLID